MVGGFAAMVFLAGSGVIDARTLYVDIARPVGGNGTSWGSAFKYLRDALDASSAGDEVFVAKGTYLPDVGNSGFIGDRELSFDLKGVSIYGGFSGKETNKNQRDPVANPTILSGEIWPVTPTTQGYERYWSLHVVVVKSSSILDGVTVEKGRANGESSPADQGGGCYVNSGAVLTLRNCVLRENLAAESGGAVWGKVVAENCSFIENLVDNEFLLVPNKTQHSWLYNPDCYGGAIRGDVDAKNCKFLRNTVNTASLTYGNRTTASGGAIYGSNVILEACVFDENAAISFASFWNTGSGASADAGSYGGAVAATNISAKSCQFTRNRAESSALAFTTPLPNEDSSPAGHTAYADAFGGAVHGIVRLSHCIFANNGARYDAFGGDRSECFGYGGAVYGEESSFITNCLYVRNLADGVTMPAARGVSNRQRIFGGGVYSKSGSTMPINHSTFFENTSGFFAGNDLYVGGEVNVMSNIFHQTGIGSSIYVSASDENADGGRARISNRLYPSPSTETFNIMTGGFGMVDGGSANVDFGEPPGRTVIDPAVAVFADPANPIGPDGLWGTADDGLRPAKDSEAIDMGHPLFVPADALDVDNDGNVLENISFDLANFLRKQGDALDLGAYEYGGVLVLPDIELSVFDGGVLVNGASEVTFGNVSGTAVQKTFSIKNVGLMDLGIFGVTVEGADASHFSVVQPNPISVAPGGAVGFSVTYNPKSDGNHAAVLRVLSNDPDENPFIVNLKASGEVSDIAVQYPAGNDLIDGASSVSFGKVPVRTTLGRVFTIRNTGLASLTIGTISVKGPGKKDFSIGKLGKKVIPAGGSTTLVVYANPAQTGEKAATLLIESNDPDSESEFNVGIKVTGITAPDIRISQPPSSELVSGDSRSYGSVKLGLTYSKTFSIKNTGSKTLKDIRVRMSGSIGSFDLEKPSAKKLKPGESTKFTVSFKPKSKGNYSARIRVTSNDADESPFDITISGSGVSKATKIRKSALVASYKKLLRGEKSANRTSTLVTTCKAIDGNRYRILTVKKGRDWKSSKHEVQVSPNLLDWFSGKKHTTVLVNNSKILQVRDNTPVTKGSKRYIRLK